MNLSFITIKPPIMSKFLLCLILSLSFLVLSGNANAKNPKAMKGGKPQVQSVLKKGLNTQLATYSRQFYTTCCSQQINCGYLFMVYNPDDGSVWSFDYFSVCDDP